MEVIYYTKQTAPHTPVFDALGTGRRRYSGYSVITPVKEWEAEHRRVQQLPADKLAEHMKHRTTYYWPPCAACDWDQVHTGWPELASARVEIKRRVRVFQASGKFPSGWMLPTTLKFGGAMLPEKQLSKVVLPFPIRYYSTKELRDGKAQFNYLAPEDIQLERVAEKYLQAMGCTRKGHTFGTPPYHGGKSPQYDVWTCGCLTSESGQRVGESCGTHKRAFEGRGDD